MTTKAKKKKQELEVGSSVGTVSPDILWRFLKTNLLRNEAHVMLARCADTDNNTWKEVIKEHSLSSDYYYEINNKTGEILVCSKKK
jgi:hypothetical protein